MDLLDVIRITGDDYRHFPLLSNEDTDDDGYADIVFGEPRMVRARRSSDDAIEYARNVMGQEATQAYYFTVAADEGVKPDDRIMVYESYADEERPFRVTRPQEAPYTGFYRFLLIPDDRASDRGGSETGSDDDGFEVVG